MLDVGERMKLNAGWSSHLPVLNRVMRKADGPVLELGAGIFSTPYLHWMCVDAKLPLWTYESEEQYVRYTKSFARDGHTIIHVTDWDKIDIDKKWSVVFIDHVVGRRVIDAIRLADKADYIVLHDTQVETLKYYGYNKLWSHFKYVKHFPQFSPQTTVVSNFKELDDL